jgi:hypothetical protein
MTQQFANAMEIYRQLLERGQLQIAYQGLMQFFRDLRTHLAKSYPSYSISSSVYYGYMDMTYIAVVPAALKNHGLKVALVFLHEAFHFEVWLSGSTRDVQESYWRHFSRLATLDFQLADDPTRQDFILRAALVEQPDFSDLDALAAQIEKGVLDFISQMEAALAETPS